MLDSFSVRIANLLEQRQRRAIETDEPYAVGSSIGSVRPRNEDVALLCRARWGQQTGRDFDLAVVCDGMGGMKNGRRAAVLGASVFTSAILQSTRMVHPHERLSHALHEANKAVLNELDGEGGTTLSAVLSFRGTHDWVIHVGDSRVYALTAQNSLYPLTTDHTLGAALHLKGDERPDANRLLQYVGMDDELDPHFHRVSHDIDFLGYILTSDGAHSAAPDLLNRVAKHSKSGPDLVRRLLSLADLLGGYDNATAIWMPSLAKNDAASGPSLSFLTVGGAQDVWLWEQSGETPAAPSRVEVQKPAAEAVREPVKASSPKNATSKKAAKKRKSPSRSKAAMLTTGLLEKEGPDEAQVSLHFPDDERGSGD